MPTIDGVLWQIKQSLDQLGFDVSHGKYPAGMLKDVKVAVDELRLTLWGILEMEESDTKTRTRGSSATIRQKLAEFRFRRMERMLTDLRKDLTKGVVPANGGGLKTLAASLQATLHSIDRLTRHKA